MALLFVYGTLRRGGSAEEKMAAFGWKGRAEVKGQLFSCGWYPGLVMGREGSVIGDVFEVPIEALPTLDDYEGCGERDSPPYEYERKTTSAIMQRGEKKPVLIYDYRAPVDELALIPSGDWFRCLDSRRSRGRD